MAEPIFPKPKTPNFIVTSGCIRRKSIDGCTYVAVFGIAVQPSFCIIVRFYAGRWASLAFLVAVRLRAMGCSFRARGVRRRSRYRCAPWLRPLRWLVAYRAPYAWKALSFAARPPCNLLQGFREFDRAALEVS